MNEEKETRQKEQTIKLNTWTRRRRKRKKCKVYIYTILYFDINSAIIMHGCMVPWRNLEILKCTNSNPVCLWCLLSNSGLWFTFHFPLTVFGYTATEHCMHACVWYQRMDSRDWRGYRHFYYLCSKCHFSLITLWEIKCFYNKLSAVSLFLKGCHSLTGFTPFLTQPCVNRGGKSNL